jgi:hypothetical protein
VGDATAVAGDAVAYIKKRKKRVGGDAAVVAGGVLDDTMKGRGSLTQDGVRRSSRIMKK